MVANRTRKTPDRRAFSQLFTVRQESPGAYDDATGKFIPGGTTDTVLTGSIQPAAGDVRQQLPENERVNETMSVWTNGIDEFLNVIKFKAHRFGTDQTRGDKLLFDGFIWSVRIVFDYGAHGHQELLVTKDDNQNG